MQGENLESARMEIGRDHAERRLRSAQADKHRLDSRPRNNNALGHVETPTFIIAAVLRRRNPQNSP